MLKKHVSWLSAKDLRHILAVYSAVALLILFILFPIYHYANKLFITSELTRWETQLDNGVKKMNSTLAGVSNAMQFTRKGSTFLSLRYQSSDQLNLVNLLEQQRILEGYFTQQDAILSGGLVFSEDLVLTREWIFYPGKNSTFYPDLFRCRGLSFDEWLSALKETGKGFLPALEYSSRAFTNTSALTYTMPWGTNATLYVLIRTDELHSMFLPPNADPAIGLSVFSNTGTLLYHAGTEASDDSYTLTQSTLGDLNIVVSIPKSLINRNLHDLRQMVILYIAAVLLIAITLTLLFACFFTYKPLYALSSKLPNTATASDFRSLLSSYRRLEDGISSMDQTIVSQRAALAQQLMVLALFRGYLSDTEKEDLLHLVPEFPVHYRLVLYRLGDNVTSEQRLHAMDLCRKTFPNCPLYTLDHDGILIVMNSDTYHREAAARVQEEMIALLSTSVHAISSEVFDRLDSLHNAWQQIVNINACAQHENLDHMLTSRDLPEKRAVMPLSISDLQTIYDALNGANLPLALSVLDSCTDHLMLNEHNTRLYQHSHIMIYRVLRQLQLENPITLGSLTIPAYVRENRNKIFAQDLPECFEQFCEELRKSRASVQKNSSSEFMTYINENLSSPNLCVDSIASHFGISGTTLQKLCKEATGSTVAAYIETQRLSKAYNLLTQTEATIAQVAQDCGFNSPNSFYKAFKRRFGTAPRTISDSDSSGS